MLNVCRRLISGLMLTSLLVAPLSVMAQDAPEATKEKAEKKKAKMDKAKKKAPVRAKKQAMRQFHKKCKKEIKTHCADVKPGQGRVLACLTDKGAEVKGGCAKAVTRANRAVAFRDACKADVRQSCSDVKPGKGRINKCLRKQEANLSEGCKQFYADRKGADVKLDVEAIDEASADGLLDDASDEGVVVE